MQSPAERIYEDLAKSHKGAKPWPALDSDFGRWMMPILTAHCERLLREKKARSKEGISPDAAGVYRLFPRKVGGEKALRAITCAIVKDGLQTVLEGTEAYAASVARWREKELEFILYPATFYNERRYIPELESRDEWKKREKVLNAAPVKQIPPEPPDWREHFAGYIHIDLPWSQHDDTSRNFIISDLPSRRRRQA